MILWGENIKHVLFLTEYPVFYLRLLQTQMFLRVNKSEFIRKVIHQENIGFWERFLKVS